MTTSRATLRVRLSGVLGSLVALTCALALGLVSPVPARANAVVDGVGRAAGHPVMLPSATANQGLATVSVRRGGRTVSETITRGRASIPAALSRAGWVHIGDPDGSGSTVVDAFQGRPGARAKLFTVTEAGAPAARLIHPLVRGEAFNNSFAAIAPGARYLVSGEWGTERRLLVFALSARLRPGSTHTEPLAGIIALSRAVRDVQGCAFRSARLLLCSTNDPTTDLFPVPRQLLALQLGRPVGPGVTPARPALVASVPQPTVCPGVPGEVEGLDVQGNLVRVLVNTRCRPETQLFTLRVGPAPSPRPDIDAVTAWLDPSPGAAVLDDE